MIYFFIEFSILFLLYLYFLNKDKIKPIDYKNKTKYEHVIYLFYFLIQFKENQISRM